MLTISSISLFGTTEIFLPYIRSEGESIDVRLIASKTCIAPIKKYSIPHLELLGAVILSRLVSYHNFEIMKDVNTLASGLLDRFNDSIALDMQP